MQYLIEIYVTAWEWIQDTRGTAAARKHKRETEQKTFWTFLSQGAVGGAIGYFLMVPYVLTFNPNDWSLVYLVILPIFLLMGAILGIVISVFIWLGSLLFKRKPGFVARAMIVAGVTTLLSVLLTYLLDVRPTPQSPLSTTVSLVCLLELPIVLMTGSSIRPCHLLLLGAGPRNARHNFGSWISYPAGFLLRVVSIFGLLETLLLLTLLISAPPWEWREFSAPESVAAIVLCVFYFPNSVYFSFKTPRKSLLLPAAIFLNVPLAAWVMHLRNVSTLESIFLAYLLLALICLWAAYALGCLIAPAPVQPAFKSWRETMATRIFPTNACQVQR